MAAIIGYDHSPKIIYEEQEERQIADNTVTSGSAQGSLKPEEIYIFESITIRYDHAPRPCYKR